MAEAANKGAALLREKLEAWGAKAELARQMAVGPDVVSRWLSGDRVPDTKQRARLEDDLGIPWRSWDDKPSQSEEPAA